MTALTWDQPGDRVFETGVDRGVLYLQDGTAVPWNGLTSFEDTTTKETIVSYKEGVKYLEYNSPGDFSGKLHAFTYPPEFDAVNGIHKPFAGLRVHDQPSKSFCLSYRTIVGDDIVGVDAAYIIHLLYNIIANPDNTQYTTLGDSITPQEFAWVLSGKPVMSDAPWRPTSHLSLDSREISSEVLTTLEDLLYGTVSTNPHFPTIDELSALLS